MQINKLFSKPVGQVRVEHRSRIEVVEVYAPVTKIHPDDKRYVRVQYPDGSSVLMCKSRLAQIERP